MDFPEVIADWPKPVDLNFDKPLREFISNEHVLFQDEPNAEALEEYIKEQNLIEEEEAMKEDRRPDEDDPNKVKVVIDVSQGKDYNWDDWCV